jgi:argininosuccinate lyase
MEKLWKGRIQGEIDEQANGFNSSIHIDARMYKQDILGSVAHAKMLGKTGIISADDAEKIVDGLMDILSAIESGTLKIDPQYEDIHSFVEGELTKNIGDAGKKLHTARSRNDQVALDARMYLGGEYAGITAMLKTLVATLTDSAEKYAETVMPGYTHMQRAQPVTLGHHLMAYAAMFMRDIERLADAKKRLLVSPLGSGALAGTTYPIDREMVCTELGFNGITLNSIDGVSDRDFAIETAFVMSLIMAHISRLCEELILWCSWEFRFVELDDAFSTGSSIMPQKKNPDIAELARGKVGRVYGDLMTLLTMVKGLPLAYNKDMQEDKEAVFDAVDTVKACLPLISGMVATMKVNAGNMRSAAAKGFINATDCADYLAKKGMPFREAYKAVGEMVAYCADSDKTLETLSLEEYKEYSEMFEEDVFDAIDLDNCVKSRLSEGGTSPESVKKQIASVRGELKNV